MNRKLLIWSVVAIIALIGIITAEVAKRMSVHDYSSNRSSLEWPERLTLDRSDPERYLRYQFNVEAGGDGSLTVRAGLCQVAGRGVIEAIDVVAADATLLIAGQPWFGEFAAREMEKLEQLRETHSLDDLRSRFIGDLAEVTEFRSDYPGFIEEAAGKHGIEIGWLVETEKEGELP